MSTKLVKLLTVGWEVVVFRFSLGRCEWADCEFGSCERRPLKRIYFLFEVLRVLRILVRFKPFAKRRQPFSHEGLKDSKVHKGSSGNFCPTLIAIILLSSEEVTPFCKGVTSILVLCETLRPKIANCPLPIAYCLLVYLTNIPLTKKEIFSDCAATTQLII